MFRHWLAAEMGAPPRIFFDADMIETGEAWPYRLAVSIAASKIMVCLWSNEYFSSPWCLAELAHMMARRQFTSQTHGPLPLVLALVIHDGEKISPHLNDIQRDSIRDYASPWIARDSLKAEKLSDKIAKFSVHVFHALQQAPECNPAWSDLAIGSFVQLYEQQVTQQKVPSLGGSAP
jgi:hypothetical protein